MRSRRFLLKIACDVLLIVFLFSSPSFVSPAICNTSSSPCLLPFASVQASNSRSSTSLSYPIDAEQLGEISTNSSPISVLIDKGHDHELQYYGLINSLLSFGYDVVEYPIPFITLAVLAQYDVFIIPAITTPYTSQEIQAIYDFVLNGGNLFVMADHSAYFSSVIQDLVNRFGITLHANKVTDPNDYVDGINFFVTYETDNFTNHAIMNNLGRLQSYASTSMDPGLANTLIFTDPDATPPNSTVAAALQLDSGGRVVVVGDSNYFNDNVADNFQFGLNIVNVGLSNILDSLVKELNR